MDLELDTVPESLEAHILTPSAGICWSWSGGQGVELAELAFQLPLFCWPPLLWLERPTPHAFATTTNSGARRFGFVIGWVETLVGGAGDAHVLVLLASMPLEWLYFETLLLAHEKLAGTAGRGSLIAAADAHVAPLLEALLCTLHEQRALCASLVQSSRETALATLCRTLRPAGLLSTLLALLTEERVLLVGSDPLGLFRATEALAAALAPLDFCGALVPLLPEGLHNAASTLLNEAVEPYIVGLHTTHFSKLKGELDEEEILTVDLDGGVLSGAVAGTSHRRVWLKLPFVVEAARQLGQAVGHGGSLGGSFGSASLSGSLTGGSLSSPNVWQSLSGFGSARSVLGEKDKEAADSKGHRRTGSQESTASTSGGGGGGSSGDEEERRPGETGGGEEMGACQGVVHAMLEKIISLEHSPLKSSSTASDRMSWERMMAMAALANALLTTPGAASWHEQAGVEQQAAVAVLLAEQQQRHALALSPTTLASFLASVWATRIYREHACAHMMKLFHESSRMTTALFKAPAAAEPAAVPTAPAMPPASAATNEESGTTASELSAGMLEAAQELLQAEAAPAAAVAARAPAPLATTEMESPGDASSSAPSPGPATLTAGTSSRRSRSSATHDAACHLTVGAGGVGPTLLRFLTDSIVHPAAVVSTPVDAPPPSSVVAAWAAADRQLAEALRSDLRPSSIGALLAHPLSHHYFRQHLGARSQTLTLWLRLWTALQPTASLVLILLSHSKTPLPTAADVPQLSAELYSWIQTNVSCDAPPVEPSAAASPWPAELHHALRALSQKGVMQLSEGRVPAAAPPAEIDEAIGVDELTLSGEGAMSAARTAAASPLEGATLASPSAPAALRPLDAATHTHASAAPSAEEVGAAGPSPRTTPIEAADGEVELEETKGETSSRSSSRSPPVDITTTVRRACEQQLSLAVEGFSSSAEFRLLSANLGLKSVSVLSSSSPSRVAHLNEGGMSVGRGGECGIRLADESIQPLHLRLHTGTLSALAEHTGLAGGTFLRGKRVRLTLLLPEDTLWLGLSSGHSGLQYRVKGLCSIESRNSASTGGASVPIGPGARGLGASFKLPRSPGPIEAPALLRAKHSRSGSLGAFRLQLTTRTP